MAILSTTIAMAVGPFGKKYQPSTQHKLLPTIAQEHLHSILDSYDYFLHHAQIEDGAPTIEIWDQIPKINTPLTAEHIQQFLNLSTPWENHHGYAYLTGLFVSYLIQKAHHAHGVDKFNLDLRSLKPLSEVCRSIERHRKRSLEVTIIGNAGVGCANECKGGRYYIEEAADSCGYYASNARFYVKHGAEDTGGLSTRCNFYIEELDLSSDLFDYRFFNIEELSTFHTSNPTVRDYLESYTGAKIKFYESSDDWNRVWQIAEQKFQEARQ